MPTHTSLEKVVNNHSNFAIDKNLKIQQIGGEGNGQCDHMKSNSSRIEVDVATLSQKAINNLEANYSFTKKFLKK